MLQSPELFVYVVGSDPHQTFQELESGIPPALHGNLELVECMIPLPRSRVG